MIDARTHYPQVPVELAKQKAQEERERLEVDNFQIENKESWMQLCQRASTEQNPEKLLQLVQQINDLLEEKRGPSAAAKTAGDGWRNSAPAPQSIDT